MRYNPRSGLFLTFIALTLFAASIQASSQALHSQKGSSSKKKGFHKFVLVKSAGGDTEDGSTFYMNLYKSFPEGWLVSVRNDRFPSPTKAREEFDRIFNASRRVKEIDRIGEKRFVLILPPEDGEVYTCILWTHGTDLFRIQGRSVEHVIAFERHFQS